MDQRLERNYLEDELYEKVVVRKRRKKAILITIAFSLFLFLCGIPVYEEQLPKWQSLKAARKIAMEIEKIKTESFHLKKPVLLTVNEDGTFKIDVLAKCEDVSSVETDTIANEHHWKNDQAPVSLLSLDDAKKLGLNMVVQQICFDPIHGLGSMKGKKVFAVIPVKDLAESRLDRASYVELQTSLATISIN